MNLLIQNAAGTITQQGFILDSLSSVIIKIGGLLSINEPTITLDLVAYTDNTFSKRVMIDFLEPIVINFQDLMEGKSTPGQITIAEILEAAVKALENRNPQWNTKISITYE